MQVACTGSDSEFYQDQISVGDHERKGNRVRAIQRRDAERSGGPSRKVQEDMVAVERVLPSCCRQYHSTQPKNLLELVGAKGKCSEEEAGRLPASHCNKRVLDFSQNP